MLRSKSLAVLFYLSAVLIGAAVGIGVDRNVVSGRLEKMRDDPRMSRDQFFAYLSATPSQRASWDSIRSNMRGADSMLMAPLREQEKLLEPQRDSIRKATNASLRALLTPDQRQLLDELQSKQQQERRQRPNDGRR